MMTGTPLDRLPNWELGYWWQTRQRWLNEGAHEGHFGDWFTGCAELGMDYRHFIGFDGMARPGYECKVVADEGDTELISDSDGRLRRALKVGAVGGARMSMDTFLRFAVETPADWEATKHRYQCSMERITEPDWLSKVEQWKNRDYPLIFAPNCQLRGFYWFARDLMGTENLSLAWYDHPDTLHDMMRFWADFLIESIRPMLKRTPVDYICINEDLAMKHAPLLSPQTYREFIAPHMERFVRFAKSHGVRYMCVDTDGNPEAMIPLLMDAGVDIIWPLERAADQDPARLRRTFGKELHLWGGVDKRELARGPAAIRAHLQSLRPMVESGGYVPHVDHTVPPDVSWDDFRYYMDAKLQLLEGRL